ncbi:hypothetical protein PHYPSEUDO_008577 [Phytophthora pseudosyringae]|uniref:Uncharacterized protein n=1 Tax=Phytophthora pseudosyringae TaxID=221518 RepID=A0A8T1VH18_9STRA|nr:hypothetical protein PHYPSEUDO_008577 [Phytophthora pseudosyringae]
MAIPYGVPVILQSVRTQKNLQNPPGSRKARCLADNRDVYEHVVLHSAREHKVSIQAAHSGRYLQVSTCGSCVFDPKSDGPWERFSIESDSDGYLHFISCHLGTVLQCDQSGVVKSTSDNLFYWGIWRIVEPHATVSFGPLVAAPRCVLAGTERQRLILELVKCGKTLDEIDQIVTRMFDAPVVVSKSSKPVNRSSVYALPIEKK